MGKTPKISKAMSIAEVVEKYPKTSSVFMKYGLFCIACPLAQQETLEQAAKVHKLDIKEFLKDLNKACLMTGKK